MNRSYQLRILTLSAACHLTYGDPSSTRLQASGKGLIPLFGNALRRVFNTVLWRMDSSNSLLETPMRFLAASYNSFHSLSSAVSFSGKILGRSSPFRNSGVAQVLVHVYSIYEHLHGSGETRRREYLPVSAHSTYTASNGLCREVVVVVLSRVATIIDGHLVLFPSARVRRNVTWQSKGRLTWLSMLRDQALVQLCY